MLRFRRASILFLLLAAVVGASCDGDDSPDQASTTSAATTKSLRNFNGEQDPSLVRHDSPGAAVLELWRFMRLGAVPLAVTMYPERVRTDVGLPALAGTLAEQEGTLRDLRPYVTAVDPTTLGPLVTLKAVGRDGRVLTYTYLMSKKARQWRVAYDSFTHSALTAYVTTRVQNSIRPGAEPSAKAREAAAQAAERYRLSALR
jgi:hypothetical protein